jgi:hypothetical protein
MFKSLFGFLEDGKRDKSVDEFFTKLREFAFYDDLKTSLAADGNNIETSDEKTIVAYFLTAKGLGYGELPKGLLKFHNYDRPVAHTVGRTFGRRSQVCQRREEMCRSILRCRPTTATSSKNLW